MSDTNTCVGFGFFVSQHLKTNNGDLDEKDLDCGCKYLDRTLRKNKLKLNINTVNESSIMLHFFYRHL